MHSWDWLVFFKPAAFGDSTYAWWVVTGLGVTVGLSVCAWILATLVGGLFGVFRTVPFKSLRVLGTAYVAVFRNIPLLVQLFFWCYVVPDLLPYSWSDWLNTTFDPHAVLFILATISIGLFTGARVCEQVRSGILALSRGQRFAALALGLTLPQTYRYVLLPQTFRIIVPPLTSEILNLIKNTAVVSTVGLLDLSKQVDNLREYTQQSYESFIVVTLVYVVLNYSVMFIMQKVAKRIQIPGLGMGAKHA